MAINFGSFREVKLCHICKGEGQIETGTYNYENIMIPCNICDSTGKVFVETFSLILPFTEKDKLNKISTKLFKIAREE